MHVLPGGAGMGVFVPAVSVVLGSGAALSAGEVGLVGSIVAGTVAVGASMSWYCHHITACETFGRACYTWAFLLGGRYCERLVVEHGQTRCPGSGRVCATHGSRRPRTLRTAALWTPQWPF